MPTKLFWFYPSGSGAVCGGWLSMFLFNFLYASAERIFNDARHTLAANVVPGTSFSFAVLWHQCMFAPVIVLFLGLCQHTFIHIDWNYRHCGKKQSKRYTNQEGAKAWYDFDCTLLHDAHQVCVRSAWPTSMWLSFNILYDVWRWFSSGAKNTCSWCLTARLLHQLNLRPSLIMLSWAVKVQFWSVGCHTACPTVCIKHAGGRTSSCGLLQAKARRNSEGRRAAGEFLFSIKRLDKVCGSRIQAMTQHHKPQCLDTNSIKTCMIAAAVMRQNSWTAA